MTVTVSRKWRAEAGIVEFAKGNVLDGMRSETPRHRVKNIEESKSAKHFLGRAWHFKHHIAYLGGGFKYFLFSPLPGEMIQFD